MILECVRSSAILPSRFFPLPPSLFNSIRTERERERASSEGKLINYESCSPIQWIDRAPSSVRASKPFRPRLLSDRVPSVVFIIYCRAWDRIQCCRPTGKLQVLSRCGSWTTPWSFSDAGSNRSWRFLIPLPCIIHAWNPPEPASLDIFGVAFPFACRISIFFACGFSGHESVPLVTWIPYAVFGREI